MSALDSLRAIVGAEHVLTAEADTAPFLTDWRKRYRGRALAVVLPASTEQVSAVVRWCAATRTPVVPQGGNTGLVGGATPDADGRAIVLATRRLRAIRTIDTANGSLVAEAGCVLAEVQAAARAAGQLFPLSLAAEGSATLGGNLATNAGGVQVLRYGNARELTLGLEVVLPTGEVWDGLRALRKDNTGYDLRDLYIGAEGTLGIITAACVKTFPLPRAQVTALAAVPTLAAGVALLRRAQDACGPTLTAFESFNALCLALVERHTGRRAPLPPSPHTVLLEVSDHRDEAQAREMVEALLGAALDEGLVTDAALAASIAQARDFWALRELISEAQAAEGRNLKHDIALPVSALADFVTRTDAAIAARFGPVRMVTFGHLGDGNLHYNVSAPPGTDEDAFIARQAELYGVVHDAVLRAHGSISAEHGIGQVKRAELARTKSAVELELMRTLKRALDPLGIMNPGKVL